MQVLFKTDNRIKGDEAFIRSVEIDVLDALGRFAPQVTRVEIYVTDENGPKVRDNDIRVSAVATVAGQAPVAVHAQADQIEAGVAIVTGKLTSALETVFGRLQSRRRSPAVVFVPEQVSEVLPLD
jgi:hypothetical protein